MQAVQGVLDYLVALMNDVKPTQLAAAYDLSGSIFRDAVRVLLAYLSGAVATLEAACHVGGYPIPCGWAVAVADKEPDVRTIAGFVLAALYRTNPPLMQRVLAGASL